jgi:hypothetical protein
MEPNFIIPEDYDSSFNKPQTNPITLEELKQQAGTMISNQYDLVISLGGKKYTGKVKQVFENVSPVVAPPEGLK